MCTLVISADLLRLQPGADQYAAYDWMLRLQQGADQRAAHNVTGGQGVRALVRPG